MISTTTSSCSTKSMEDVWKDISLASLSRNTSDNTTTTTSTHHPTADAFRSIMLQDFLASTSTTSSNIDPPPPAAASPVLRLNCGTRSDLKQHVLETTSTTITGPPLLKPYPITRPTSTSVTTTTTRPNSLNNPSSVFPSCCMKRALYDHDQNHEDHHNSTNGGGRHRRMMKNRESAARSRARKQAYINELEIEIAQLREENATLKRQLQAKSMINSSYLAAPTLAQQLLPKRQTLFRTSTAPF